MEGKSRKNNIAKAELMICKASSRSNVLPTLTQRDIADIAWTGERQYFASLVAKLEPIRKGLGRPGYGPCIQFYRAARHKDWTL